MVAAVPGREDCVRRFRTRGGAGSGVGKPEHPSKPREPASGRRLLPRHARDRTPRLAAVRRRLRVTATVV